MMHDGEPRAEAERPLLSSTQNAKFAGRPVLLNVGWRGVWWRGRRGRGLVFVSWGLGRLLAERQKLPSRNLINWQFICSYTRVL